MNSIFHCTKTPPNNKLENLTWVINMQENIYIEQGYESRKDYLECLSGDYDCPLENVIALADLLGEEEMFDGLVSALEDYYSE